MLTIETVNHLHPFAFALLNLLLFKGVLSLDKLGPPFLDTVLLTHTVKFLVDIGTCDLNVGLVVTSYTR
jgi:hypothetical protein